MISLGIRTRSSLSDGPGSLLTIEESCDNSHIRLMLMFEDQLIATDH
jgi:hypothetical protein